MSQKNKDKYNRWRSKTIAFRVTPEEYELINNLVEIYGISKQEFLTSNMLKHSIEVTGSIKAFKGVKRQLDIIIEQLEHSSPSDEQLLIIKSIIELYRSCESINTVSPSTK